MNTHRTPRTGRRLAAGLALIAGGTAMLLSPLGAPSAGAADSGPYITITQTPNGNVADCVEPAAAMLSGLLKPYPQSDADTFKLTINLQAPLCTPLSGKAVVYKMPADGSLWPQKLAEVKDFTISQPGDTVITFAKMCDAVQYDVISGNAPDILNTGFDQQLFFPGNLETAYQFPGSTTGECLDAASTTSATSTTTTTAAVTTTTGNVLGTTTIAGPTTTKGNVEVLAVTTVPRSNAGAALAATGSTSRPFALIGGGLVLVGAAVTLAARRRYA